jgi:hypothetical protein
MDKKRIGVLACLALIATGLMFGSNNALAVFGMAGWGSTSISPSSCSADISGELPAVIEIRNYDTVEFYYGGSWSDTRQANSPVANHYYNMTVTYLGISQYRDYSINTYGSTSGSTGTLEIDVTNAQEDTYVWVYWYARLTSSSCSPQTVSDTVSGWTPFG